MKNKQSKAEKAWLLLILAGLILVGYIATHSHQ